MDKSISIIKKNGKKIFSMITESEIEKYRFDSFWWKEFETLIWIDSFNNGDVFFDVGANIGIYSLYCAAIHPKSEVLSFEPSQANFDRLCENIVLNKFNQISPFQIAFGDYEYCCGFFYENIENPGESGGQFGFNKKFENFNGETSVNGMRLDYFSWANRIDPNHIKIDIDGQEWKVIQGMTETLKDKNLQSVLIEINDHKIEIFKAFYDAGFTSDNRFNFLENHSRVRREKEGIKAENIIFTRREA